MSYIKHVRITKLARMKLYAKHITSEWTLPSDILEYHWKRRYHWHKLNKQAIRNYQWPTGLSLGKTPLPCFTPASQSPPEAPFCAGEPQMKLLIVPPEAHHLEEGVVMDVLNFPPQLGNGALASANAGTLLVDEASLKKFLLSLIIRAKFRKPYTDRKRHINSFVRSKWRGADSNLPVAHTGYQVLSDILFRLCLALFYLSGKPSGIWLLTINFMPFSLVWAAGLEVGVTLAERK